MRRVVVTGIGIVSSIGNNADEVLASLREAKSGITFTPEYAELGFRSQVHGCADPRKRCWTSCRNPSAVRSARKTAKLW